MILDMLYDYGRYQEYFEHMAPKQVFGFNYNIAKGLLAGWRAGETATVRKLVHEGIENCLMEINELKEDKACGASLNIIALRYELIAAYLALKQKTDALEMLEKNRKYIEALIEECKRNNLPYRTYEWILENVGADALLDDVDSYFEALIKSCLMKFDICTYPNELGPHQLASHSRDGTTVDVYRPTISQHFRELVKEMASGSGTGNREPGVDEPPPTS